MNWGDTLLSVIDEVPKINDKVKASPMIDGEVIPYLSLKDTAWKKTKKT